MTNEKTSKLRNYFTTVLTSVLVLILVGNYVFWVIPSNKKRLDNEHLQVLSHLRENFEKVNHTITRDMVARDANMFCTNDEDTISIRFSKEGMVVTKTNDTLLKKIHAYETAYNRLFTNTRYETIAIAGVGGEFCYHKGNSEPNLERISAEQKINSDFNIVEDTVIKRLRYYVYNFKPQFSQNKVLLILAVKSEDFDREAKAINPVNTLYVVLLLILLFLTVPLLRSVISSRFENLNVLDVVSSTTALGTMTLLVVIVIMCYSTYHTLRNSQEATLRQAATVLRKNFETEFNYYERTLKTLDKNIAGKKNVRDAMQLAQNKDSDKVDAKTDKLLKKNIFRYFIVNKKSKEIANYYYSANDTTAITKNALNERAYFRFHLENQDKDGVYIEPVYSWKDHGFRICMSEKISPQLTNNSVSENLNCNKPFVSVLSFYPLANKSALLPDDYGYAVVDANGLVQMHSDSTKNLAENFIKEAEEPLWIKKEMALNNPDNSVYESYYNGSSRLMYLQKINVAGNSNPLYLVVYRNLAFAQNLLLYSVVTGFITAFAYAWITILFAYILSAFYYHRHVKFISAFHFGWLFPDRSKTQVYKQLMWLDALAVALVLLVSCFSNLSFTILFALNTGLLLVFVHFVFLVKKFKWSKKEKTAFVLNLILLYLVMILPVHASLKIIIELGMCLVFLKMLSIFEQKGCNQNKANTSEGNNKLSYLSFLTSMFAYQYAFIPMLVFLCIVCCEKNRSDYYSNIQIDKLRTENNQIMQADVFNNGYKAVYSRLVVEPSAIDFENLLGEFDFIGRPSVDYISQLVKTNVPLQESAIAITEKNETHQDISLFQRVYDSDIIAPQKVILFILVLFALTLVLYGLLSYFTQRFFYFDYREMAAKLFQSSNFEKTILTQLPEKALRPLYNELTPAKLFAAESVPELKNGAIDAMFDNQHTFRLSYYQRLSLSYQIILAENTNNYKAALDNLNKSERFVLTDLAQDNFVNYRNKDVLLKLIQKGFVIADPETGTLRVVSQSLRIYILNGYKEPPFKPAEGESPEPEPEPEQESVNWKTPLMIVAISIAIFLLYVNGDMNAKVISFGGSTIAALGFILKFTGTFQDGFKK